MFLDEQKEFETLLRLAMKYIGKAKDLEPSRDSKVCLDKAKDLCNDALYKERANIKATDINWEEKINGK